MGFLRLGFFFFFSFSFQEGVFRNQVFKTEVLRRDFFHRDESFIKWVSEFWFGFFFSSAERMSFGDKKKCRVLSRGFSENLSFLQLDRC